MSVITGSPQSVTYMLRDVLGEPDHEAALQTARWRTWLDPDRRWLVTTGRIAEDTHVRIKVGSIEWPLPDPATVDDIRQGVYDALNAVAGVA